MSKRINVNPDHYKQAGRTRPGDDVVHTRSKQRPRRAETEASKRAARRRPRKRAAAADEDDGATD